MKKVNYIISDELHKDLKIYCAENDVSMTKFVEKAIEEKLEKSKTPQQNKKEV